MVVQVVLGSSKVVKTMADLWTKTNEFIDNVVMSPGCLLSMTMCDLAGVLSHSHHCCFDDAESM